MIRLARYMSALLLALTFLAVPVAQAQTNLSRESQDRLYKIMDAQDELTEEDVKLYLQHTDAIFSLRFDPSKISETARLIGWPDKRFAYVTTKVAAGMALLVNRDDPRNSSIPEFARPTSSEMKLLQRFQGQLEAALSQAQRAHAAN